MKNLDCLYCKEQKNSFSWSGASIDPPTKIFSGSYLRIVELLENPWQDERYPKEQVLQCIKCNTIWHIDYYFPDRPPLHVNAKVIPKNQLSSFFVEIGEKLAKTYEQPK